MRRLINTTSSSSSYFYCTAKCRHQTWLTQHPPHSPPSHHKYLYMTRTLPRQRWQHVALIHAMRQQLNSVVATSKSNHLEMVGVGGETRVALGFARDATHDGRRLVLEPNWLQQRGFPVDNSSTLLDNPTIHRSQSQNREKKQLREQHRGGWAPHGRTARWRSIVSDRFLFLFFFPNNDINRYICVYIEKNGDV